MTKPAFRLAAMGALALLYSAAPIGQAQAAEGHDNCDAFIALTGTINAPGTYCLKSGITSTLTSGAAITIAADNVTIDCNGHVIRDSTTSSMATGIKANQRENITIRNCSIAGFNEGVRIDSGSGHLVEDNLVRGSRKTGIRLAATSNSEVRANRVVDLQQNSYVVDIVGISADANVVENVVAGITGTKDLTIVYGIKAYGAGNEVRGNFVRNLTSTTGDAKWGIYAEDAAMALSGNHVTSSGYVGIRTQGSSGCTGNTVTGFEANYSGGCQALDNL